MKNESFTLNDLKILYNYWLIKSNSPDFLSWIQTMKEVYPDSSLVQKIQDQMKTLHKI